MELRDHGESVQFADVRVIRDTGLAWLCLIDGKQVAVPRPLMLTGSTVTWPRVRRGTVVIPRSLAVRLRLSVPPKDHRPSLRERLNGLQGHRLLPMAGILVAPLVVTGYVGLAALLFLPLLGLRWVFPRRSWPSLLRLDGNEPPDSDMRNFYSAATGRA